MTRTITTTLLTATLLAGGVALAQAQTAADGSTSPGGMITSSQMDRGGYGYGYGAPYGYGAAYGSVYAGPRPYYPAGRAYARGYRAYR